MLLYLGSLINKLRQNAGRFVAKLDFDFGGVPTKGRPARPLDVDANVRGRPRAAEPPHPRGAAPDAAQHAHDPKRKPPPKKKETRREKRERRARERAERARRRRGDREPDPKPDDAPDADRPKPAPAHKRKLRDKVDAALKSNDPDTRLEGQVADEYFDRLVDFQREVPGAGRQFGEVDVELDNVIIEVTAGTGGKKSRQVSRKYTNPAANPKRKPVIVFILNKEGKVGGTVREKIQKAGAHIAKSWKELEDLVNSFPAKN